MSHATVFISYSCQNAKRFNCFMESMRFVRCETVSLLLYAMNNGRVIHERKNLPKLHDIVDENLWTRLARWYVRDHSCVWHTCAPVSPLNASLFPSKGQPIGQSLEIDYFLIPTTRMSTLLFPVFNHRSSYPLFLTLINVWMVLPV